MRYYSGLPPAKESLYSKLMLGTPVQALQQLRESIMKAQSIILSTHKQCDGDGLGAELALFFALKKLNKKVEVINVDPTPRKYRFLAPDAHIRYFESTRTLPVQADLVIIFDTNDSRLLEPLYTQFKQAGSKIIFIDHHPILKMGPAPTDASWIDTSAASTGEMAYRLIKELNVPMDVHIARALYTSLTFDTQIFRYIRNSPVSHQIAAELLHFPIEPHLIHRHLFGEQTVEKMKMLADAFGKIEFFYSGKLAVLKLQSEKLRQHKMDPDDSRDVIDQLMNVETLEAAALFREDSESFYKLSLRSKGHIEVLGLAEKFGGGGHIYAAGAQIKGDYEELKKQVVEFFKNTFR